jgi:hypothetical protein
MLTARPPKPLVVVTVTCDLSLFNIPLSRTCVVNLHYHFQEITSHNFLFLIASIQTVGHCIHVTGGWTLLICLHSLLTSWPFRRIDSHSQFINSDAASVLLISSLHLSHVPGR